MRVLGALALIASLSFGLPAAAGTVVIDGDTTGGPTYNRPLATMTGLSGTGTNVAYQVTTFTVSTSGAYSLLSEAGYDNFLGLYAGAFGPTQPLLNALAYNDDLDSLMRTSGFTTNLLAGVSYFAVASGFGNNDFGAYKLTISGPGDIGLSSSAVPEPATWAMMIAGFGLVASALRRRKGARALAA